MEFIDYLVLSAVAIGVFFAIRSIVRNRKKGCNGCCSSCSNCCKK